MHNTHPLWPGLLACTLFLAACGGDREVTADDIDPETLELIAGKKRFGLQSGIVHYELDGARKGTETLYFTDWGWREAKHSDGVISFMGFEQPMRTLSILEDSVMAILDLESGMGMRTLDPLKSLLSDDELQDPAAVGVAMMKQMGATRDGDGEVLGRKCQVWKVKDIGSRLWVWRNIPLKMETKMMGIGMSMTATRIEENVPVPEKRFSFPEGVDPSSFELVEDPKQLMKAS
jgi:hypothetical protein